MIIEVLDPTGRVATTDDDQPVLAHRLTVIEGAPIGFLDNLKPGASFLLGALRTETQRTLDVQTVYFEKTGPRGSSGPLEAGEKVAEQVGAVINALGD